MTRGGSEPDSPAAWCALASDALIVRIVARPGSVRSGILRVDQRGLVVALQAPPDKGRANDELIELLARSLRVPRGVISLIRGGTARAKTIRIASGRPREVAAALAALIPTQERI